MRKNLFFGLGIVSTILAVIAFQSYVGPSNLGSSVLETPDNPLCYLTTELEGEVQQKTTTETALAQNVVAYDKLVSDSTKNQQILANLIAEQKKYETIQQNLEVEKKVIQDKIAAQRTQLETSSGKISTMSGNTCPLTETLCSNSVDDDRDGTMDCGDSDCSSDVSCIQSVCGNAFVESGETCDDGNTFDGDTCSSNCSSSSPLTTCGDGIVQNPNSYGQSELCDDGPLNGNMSSCDANCLYSVSTYFPLILCGNGYVEGGEMCDDGNMNHGDGCSGSCQTEQISDLTATPAPPEMTFTDPVSSCGNGVCEDFETNALCSTDCVDMNSAPVGYPACTLLGAHNYDPLALYDNGTCTTCMDNVKNGDEEDIDCGGQICSVCKKEKGCTDPQAINYSPTAQEDDGSCYYRQTENRIPYCDVPTATNHEMHDTENDPLYVASTEVCQFCGNGTVDSTVANRKVSKPGEFYGEVTGTAVYAYETCDDGNNAPYDGCVSCNVEPCAAEKLLCNEYGFKGDEEESTLKTKLSAGLTKYPASSDTKRPQWVNSKQDTVKTADKDFTTFGSVCLREGNRKITSFSGFHTEFGYKDTQDNGFGSSYWGNGCKNCTIGNIKNGTIKTGESGEVSTNNTIIRGVAIPQDVLNTVIGTESSWRKIRVKVTGKNGCFIYPIVDFGPDEYTWTRVCSGVLDMTHAAAVELGIQGGSKKHSLRWQLLTDSGVDPRTMMTLREITLGKPSSTWDSNAYTYRTGTTIDYPTEFFTSTPCN